MLFSSAFPAMFGTFVKYQFQRTYDAILAAPVDTEELVTAEALWIATRAGVYGCVPMVVAIVRSGSTRPGDADSCRSSRGSPGFGWASFGIMVAGYAKSIRELQLHRQRRADAALPRRRDVLPARATCREWAQFLAKLNPLHHCVELVCGAAFGWAGWTDLLRVAFRLFVQLYRSGASRSPRCSGSQLISGSSGIIATTR